MHQKKQIAWGGMGETVDLNHKFDWGKKEETVKFKNAFKFFSPKLQHPTTYCGALDHAIMENKKTRKKISLSQRPSIAHMITSYSHSLFDG